MSEPEPALVLHFVVDVGDESLGRWQKCEGLQVEWEVHEYKEGGQNDFVHRLPTRAKHQNIKLTRPITGDTGKVAAWVSQVHTTAERKTATITVKDAGGTAIAAWRLEAVFPIRWTGPNFDVGTSQVATETLEIAHHGFAYQPPGA